MTNYAKFETKGAALSKEFGRDFACKLFGEDVVAQMPVYKRGPKKGLPKGFVCWQNCYQGGWVNEGFGYDDGPSGYVMKPGKVLRAWLTLDYMGDERTAISLNWLGRVQTVAGDREYLFMEGRAREAARQVAYKEEQALQLEAVKQEALERWLALNMAIAWFCHNKPEQSISVFTGDRDKYAAIIGIE